MNEQSNTELPPKQLFMVIDAAAVRRLLDVPVPEGYVLRTYRPGDEVSWSRTLKLGGFTNWDVEKVLEYVENAERRAGSQLVEHEGEIVAATFASRISNRPPGAPGVLDDPSKEGVLDYVVTDPSHQGHGLGRITCTEVSRFLIDHGCEVVSLKTDDCRLPAIHIYLSMGYKPVMHREDMPGRWEKVINELKESGREYS